jgi:calcineurin-like phosphoesterase family protein
MPNVFLISDTHFGHDNMYRFTNADGTRVRHQFANAAEGDQTMIENWNNVVKPTDKVYHLGDVFINRKARFILEALNGKKVLIKGNHDIFDLDNYVPYFKDIRAYHVLDKFIISHIPIHKDSIERFKGNVHGHLHSNVVLDKSGHPDVHYKSVCVEHINYTPIELSEIQTYFNSI